MALFFYFYVLTITFNIKKGEKMELQRKNDETSLQHHKRLVYGKLVDKTLSDVDYSELAEFVYGQSYSSDVARRMMYGSRKTLELIDADSRDKISDSDLLSELDESIIKLKKERQKFFDQRTAFNKVVRERSRQEELNEILVDAVKNGSLPQLNYIPNSIAPSDKDMLVSLNDIHYGIFIDNAWNKYNSDVCVDMMRNYLDQIIHINNTHDCENCIVWMNGDAISGRIHQSIQIENKENCVEQIKGVSELIAEFLAELSSHFRAVKFVSVAGNHSRLDSKDKVLRNERLDDLVEWYLSARLQDYENVEVITDKLDSTMYAIDVRGKTYVGVHGDFDGSLSKIAALQAMVRKPIYAVLSGHLHHNRIETVQGIKNIMAGAFVGVDDYCVQKRIYGEPEQLVCICDNGGIVCYYDVQLSDK